MVRKFGRITVGVAIVWLMTCSSSSAASWKYQTGFEYIPGISNELLGISCVSGKPCLGVGSAKETAEITVPQAVVEIGGWHSEPPLTPTGQKVSVLRSTACFAAKECMTVGSAQHGANTKVTLAEKWEESFSPWVVVTTPNPTGAKASALRGVSCPSTTYCVSVGSYTSSGGTSETLTEVWSEKKWAIQKSPNPTGASASTLNAVSCTTTTACTAVGNYTNAESTIVTLVERWNGAEWKVQTSPNPAEETKTVLLGVSCVAATTCYASGGAQHGANTQITLGEIWNGTEWKIQTTPNPTGAKESGFQGISCISASVCEAVGDYVNSEGKTVSLAERWGGTEWVLQETFKFPDAFTVLFSVSCSGEAKCEADGASGKGAGETIGFVEGYE